MAKGQSRPPSAGFGKGSVNRADSVETGGTRSRSLNRRRATDSNLLHGIAGAVDGFSHSRRTLAAPKALALNQDGSKDEFADILALLSEGSSRLDLDFAQPSRDPTSPLSSLLKRTTANQAPVAQVHHVDLREWSSADRESRSASGSRRPSLGNALPPRPPSAGAIDAKANAIASSFRKTQGNTSSAGTPERSRPGSAYRSNSVPAMQRVLSTAEMAERNQNLRGLFKQVEAINKASLTAEEQDTWLAEARAYRQASKEGDSTSADKIVKRRKSILARPSSMPEKKTTDRDSMSPPKQETSGVAKETDPEPQADEEESKENKPMQRRRSYDPMALWAAKPLVPKNEPSQAESDLSKACNVALAVSKLKKGASGSISNEGVRVGQDNLKERLLKRRNSTIE